MLSPKDEIIYLSEIETPLAEDEEIVGKRQESKKDNAENLNKRGQDTRLHELEQQLEIAETRCDTLKQQLDYMKSLYQGVNKTPYEEGKQKRNSKRKGNIKERVKRVNAESPIENKLSETSLIKTLPKTISSVSSSAKTSPRHYIVPSITENKFEATQVNNLITDLTRKDIFGSHGDENPEIISPEPPIRDYGAHSRPESEKLHLRPRSSPQNGDYYFEETGESARQDEKLGKSSSAVQVIQDILSGITDSVNRISQLNVYINDGGKDTNSPDSFTEQNINNDQTYISATANNDENDGEALKAIQEDLSVNFDKILPETEKQFNLNSCSDSNVDHIYKKDFQKIKADMSIKRKHNKPRSGKRDIPPKLLANCTTDSVESIRGNKRKGKLHGKHNEKKSRGLVPYSQINKLKPRITEDVISVTTKVKRKRSPKLKNCNSRSTIGCRPDRRDLKHGTNSSRGDGNQDFSFNPTSYEMWQGDNVVELYHNASVHAEMSASEENLTRNSHASRSSYRSRQKYLQMQDYLQRELSEQQKKYSQNFESYSMRDHNDSIYHNSDDSGDEMMTAERIMQKVIDPVTNEEDLQRTFDTPCLDRQNNIINVVIPTVNLEGKSDEIIEQRSCHLPSVKKNFQLPTVSSKMKQVEKCCQNRFNFHNIPFVAGTSTSPSHNLGLNIQQVLSIIKTRQPVSGISPVGHINRHFSGISQRPCMGPLPYAPRQKLYCQSVMQDDIPELPEKDDIGLDKSYIPDSEHKSHYGGQYLNTRPMTAIQHYCEGLEHKSILNREQMPDEAWTVDQDNPENKETRSNLRCTCFPTRRCVNYQKILNQFLESGEKLSFLRTNHPVSQIPYRPQSLRQHFSTMSRTQHVNNMEVPQTKSGQSLNEKHIAEMSVMRDVQNQVDVEKRSNKAPDFYVDIQGRATSLKEVLTNLHEDFSRLNSKYDELQAGVTQDTVDETEAMKQLEVMEIELQAKEEEITVVMALYKEVMTLKEQVKALKERASLANLANRPAQRMKQRIVAREPTAAVRLTKLLRTIQQFQDRLRNN